MRTSEAANLRHQTVIGMPSTNQKRTQSRNSKGANKDNSEVEQAQGSHGDIVFSAHTVPMSDVSFASLDGSAMDERSNPPSTTAESGDPKQKKNIGQEPERKISHGVRSQPKQSSTRTTARGQAHKNPGHLQKDLPTSPFAQSLLGTTRITAATVTESAAANDRRSRKCATIAIGRRCRSNMTGI